MDIEDFHDLLAPAGQRLLQQVAHEYDESDPLSLAARLRRDYPARLVAAALTQTQLRQQAHAKFGADSSRLYFTADSLEQATPQPVAAHRAARLRGAGIGTVADLGCGVGGDLIALARAGLSATGVDRDPLRVEIARANLAALGLAASVRLADAEEVELGAYDAVFVDPARRDETGRIFQPQAHSPSWSFVERLLHERAACVKTSPALPRDLAPCGTETEWVSLRGDVKEAALWSTPLSSATRRATLLPGGHALTEADERSASVGPVRDVLYEPDAAVIRAGLVGAVAQHVDGTLLDEHIAYLCADRHVVTPFARAYRVLEELPFRERALRAALRDRDVGTLTIKKRGITVAPETLRRRLALRGRRAATLVLSRGEHHAVALLVDPHPAP